jgi:hypothetical protein
MDNKLLHQTLVELEDNLSQLESARNQVNQVSKKSEDLVIAFSKILRQIDKIEKENLFEDLDIKKKVEASLEKFKKDMQFISDGFLEKNKQLSLGWKTEIEGMSSSLQKAEKSLQKFENELKTSEKKIASFDIKADFDKLFLDYRNEINKIASNQLDGLSTLKTQINFGIKETHQRIKEIDTKNVLAELKKKIETNTLDLKRLEEKFESQIQDTKEEINKSAETINSKVDQLGNRMMILNIVLAVFFVLLLFLIK